MRFGVSINDVFSAAVEDAVWADEAGLDLVAMPDHVLRAQATDPALAAASPAPDPFVQLAAIATATRRVELATLCSPVTFRHPATLLKSGIELSCVSRGRFTLGLGTGYRREEHEVFGIPFPPTAERYQMLEETLGYVAAGRSEPSPGYAGTRYQLAEHPVAPPPDNLRLLVGGGGATKTPDLAGRLADEYNIFLTDHDGMRARIERARSAFAEAGRAGQLRVSSAATLVVGRDETELERAACRQARRAGGSAEAFLRRHRSSGRSLVGTASEVADRLRAIAALGVSACCFVFDGRVHRDGVLAVRDAYFAAATPHGQPSTSTMEATQP